MQISSHSCKFSRSLLILAYSLRSVFCCLCHTTNIVVDCSSSFRCFTHISTNFSCSCSLFFNSTGNSTRNIINLINDFAYFTADDGTHGKELWRTDGTEDGTFMVKDINPDGESYPLCLTALGDEVLFKADDGTHGKELWKSDGTENGTVLLKDIRIGEGGSTIGCRYNRHTDLLGESQGFITFGNSVYFSANNGTWTDENRTGSEMWRSDGTSEGTYLVKDLNPGVDSGFQGHMQVLGNHLYFLGNDNGGNGTELWKTDGTEEGTVLLKDINPCSMG